MNKTFKRITNVLVLSLLFLTMLVPSALAASLTSFSMNNSGREFEVNSLTFSLGKPSTQYYGIAEQFYNAISAGESVQYFKFSYNDGGTIKTDYVSTGTFAYYINPSRSSTIDEAIAKCKAAQKITPMTKIAKFYSNADVISTVLEGPQILSQNSSISIGRYPDSTTWQATEITANANNPVGQLKFAFSKDLNKSSLDNIHIYLNGSSSVPDCEALIKAIIFGEFIDRSLPGTLSNELSCDFFMTYSQLKNALTVCNDDVAVTQLKIEGLATDNTWVSMTIDIL